MRKLWFKNKTYGYGWVPAAWQGWVALLVFFALELGNFFRLNRGQGLEDANTVIEFVAESLLLTVVLLIVCYKTGEKPEWRWGKD